MNRTDLDLPCALNDEEVQQRGRVLSELVVAIDDTERARTASMKEFKEVLTGLHERQRELSLAIRTRVEKRMVGCSVEFHTPTEGLKTIVRLDTGEIVREETMTDAERQLNLFGSERGKKE